MPAILILGMDNTGKTTLIQNMEAEIKRTRTSVKVVKSPGPVSATEMIQWVSEQVVNINNNPETMFIYDRFCCFDEPVYGPIVRGTTPSLIEPMLNMIKTVDPILVYARPEAADIVSFKDGREQMEGVQEYATDLLIAYDYLIMSHLKRFPVIIYDYNKSKAEDVLDEAISTWVNIQSMKISQNLVKDMFSDIDFDSNSFAGNDFDMPSIIPTKLPKMPGDLINDLLEGIMTKNPLGNMPSPRPSYGCTCPQSGRVSIKVGSVRNNTKKAKQMNFNDLEKRGN